MTVDPHLDGGPEEVPTLHDPSALRGRPVLNLTSAFYFSASTDPNDILYEVPLTGDSVGKAFWLGQDVLLGFRILDRGHIREGPISTSGLAKSPLTLRRNPELQQTHGD